MPLRQLLDAFRSESESDRGPVETTKTDVFRSFLKNEQNRIQ